MKAGLALTRVLPEGVSRALARLAGHTAPLLARTRYDVLRQNARFLSPSLSVRAIDQQARRTFVNFFDAAVDVLRFRSLSPEARAELVDIHGLEHVADTSEGRGVVIVAGHMGPYEMAAAAVAARGIELSALVEDLDPETNAAMSEYREATGLRILSRNSGLRQMYRVLRSGGRVALVADRVIGETMMASVEVAFGSGRRLVPTGPASFALATGARVVIGHVVRPTAGGVKHARYRLVFEPLPVADGVTAEQLTVSIAARLADLTQRYPDQWFVFQPDWR